MNEIKNKGIYPILASACFIVYAIVFFASSRRDLYNIIWLFIYFSYGVLFFVRKKNMGIVIVACISILTQLYMFALYFNIV